MHLGPHVASSPLARDSIAREDAEKLGVALVLVAPPLPLLHQTLALLIEPLPFVLEPHSLVVQRLFRFFSQREGR
jgi:hypothetical protein